MVAELGVVKVGQDSQAGCHEMMSRRWWAFGRCTLRRSRGKKVDMIWMVETHSPPDRSHYQDTPSSETCSRDG